MMVVFIVAVLTYLRAYFVRRHNLALEAAALRQQRVVSNANNRDQRCTAWIVGFGLRFGICGLDGRMP